MKVTTPDDNEENADDKEQLNPAAIDLSVDISKLSPEAVKNYAKLLKMGLRFYFFEKLRIHNYFQKFIILKI